MRLVFKRGHVEDISLSGNLKKYIKGRQHFAMVNNANMYEYLILLIVDIIVSYWIWKYGLGCLCRRWASYGLLFQIRQAAIKGNRQIAMEFWINVLLRKMRLSQSFRSFGFANLHVNSIKVYAYPMGTYNVLIMSHTQSLFK